MALLFLVLSVGGSAWGVSHLQDGLDLTDLVPSGTTESRFLEAQQKYFGFYNMLAVTQGNFEYPTQQKILLQYHEAFNRVPWIIKNDDGGLPDSWLTLFREWLLSLQRSFDADWEKGFINEEGWDSNATDRGVLAYKLLVQTGHVDHPVDRSLASQVRLVDSEGIINPKAFYNYLSAWATNDALAYSASQADLRPVPRFWNHERSDFDLKIPKSSPIVYAQYPFYLNRLDSTEIIINMIEEVRGICKKFEDKGLPNFPTGVPFTFWEQYIRLRFFLVLALVAVLAAVFLILSISLANIWAPALVVLFLATLVLQIAGLLGIAGLKLSAAPAVLLVTAVGAGVEFSIPFTICFLTAVGDRNRRVRIALMSMADPCIHGGISTILAGSMMFFADFDFVRRYFFYTTAAIVVLSALNGLFFLPAVFSIVGPPPQLSPRGKDIYELPVPTPPPSPLPPSLYSMAGSGGIGSSRRSYHNPHHKNSHSTSPHHQLSPHHSAPQMVGAQHHHHSRRPYGSNLSLTTITEEPGSNGSEPTSNGSDPGTNGPCDSTSSSRQSSSHEILVEPQVVVEVNGGRGRQDGSPAEGGVIYHEGSHHMTTTVTATAKVKVELHNKALSGSTPDNVHRTNANASPYSSNKRSSNNRCSNSGSSSNFPPNISVNSSCSSSCSSSSDRSRSKEFSNSKG